MGTTSDVRSGLYNVIFRRQTLASQSLTDANLQAVTMRLVTAVTAGMRAGGAVANVITLTGYTNAAIPDGTIFGAPTDGVGANGARVGFGTADQGQGSQSATHVAFCNAAGDCKATGQLLNAAGDAAEPLVIDTASNPREIFIDTANLDIEIAEVADI